MRPLERFDGLAIVRQEAREIETHTAILRLLLQGRLKRPSRCLHLLHGNQAHRQRVIRRGLANVPEHRREGGALALRQTVAHLRRAFGELLQLDARQPKEPVHRRREAAALGHG